MTFDPDKLLRDAIDTLAGGFNVEDGGETNRQAQQALLKLAKELQGRDLTDVPTAQLFKSWQMLVKGLDEHVRLTQFCSGKADSRPDLGMQKDVISCLTDTQLAQVMQWVGENANAKAADDAL